MKKTRKIIAFILSMIMIISMTSITAVAEGLDSNANSDGTTTGNSLSGGPCASKTGFYVTVSTGPSDGSSETLE